VAGFDRRWLHNHGPVQTDPDQWDGLIFDDHRRLAVAAEGGFRPTQTRPIRSLQFDGLPKLTAARSDRSREFKRIFTSERRATDT
jgi:hypothetical protein